MSLTCINIACREKLKVAREALTKAFNEVNSEKSCYQNELRSLERERRDRISKGECLHSYLSSLAGKQRRDAEVAILDRIRKESAELKKRLLAEVEAELDAEKRKHAALLIEVDDEAEKRAQKRKLRRTVRGAKVCKYIYILNLYSPLLLSTPL